MSMATGGVARIRLGRRLRLTALGAVALVASGHVGTYDAWFEGDAGPYPVQVVIRAPGVIPGLAEIMVRVRGDDVERVLAATAFWTSGPEGLPPPDVAEPVPGEADLWATRLWFMAAGAHRVHVTVEGGRGRGVAVIPYDAVPTRMMGMDPLLGWILAGFGAFLLVGMLSIVGAATREGTLEPGARPDRRRRRRAVVARIVAAFVLALVLAGGKRWWDAEDARYSRRVWEPTPVEVHLDRRPDGPLLVLDLADRADELRGASPLIPDHGRMMHLFLLDSATTAMAHLHPVREGDSRFVSPLPPVDAGSYRVFAEVLHGTGFRRTMVGRIRLPEPPPASDGWRSPDPEDGWLPAGREAPDGRIARLPDGTLLAWERGDTALAAGREAPLRFTVRDERGDVVRLEPYLGMAAHAVVERDDGAIFVHLHPTGTTSQTAEAIARVRAEAAPVAGHGAHPAEIPVWRPNEDRAAFEARVAAAGYGSDDGADGHGFAGDFRFPWGFPEPGRYRIWVQVRRGGEVMTGAFVADVDG